MSIRNFRIRSPLLVAAFVFARLVLPTGLQAADEPKPDAEPQAVPQEEPQQEPADYEVMPLPAWALGDTPQDKKQRNDLDVRKEAILRGSEPFTADATKKFLGDYYSRYSFALLTHPKNIGDWPKTRVNLTRTLAATNMQTPPLLQVHDFLVDVLSQAMLPLIRGNYHPAVRCNAMLLLGSLNSQDPLFVGDAKRPAVPLIQSLKVMLDELANPQQIDGVRAAALVGILRHVEIDRQLENVPGAQRRLVGNNAENLIADAMLKLVNEKQSPEGRSQAGHDWMRRRAVEILGYLGSPGQGSSVLAGLDGVLTDNKAPVALRCSAAEAIGRLKLPANANIKVSDTAKKLATVAVFACQKEIQRVEEQEAREAKDKLQAAGGAGYGMGMGSGYMDTGSYGGSMGGMPGMMPDMGGMPYGMSGGMPGYGMPGGTPAAKFNPLGYRILLTRRRIAHEMLLVKRGLLGPDATLKTSPAAAAARTSPTAPPPPPKAGLSALVKAGADQTAVDDALNGIDTIIKVVEQSTFNEMKALVEELRGKVRQMEDKCGIVVELEEEPVAGAALDNPLANPLDVPAGIPGLEMPSVPAEPPAAAPAGQVPAGPPAAAAPEAATPAVPPPAVPAPAGAPEPAAGGNGPPVPPAPAPGAPAPAPPAVPPPAAVPAAGNAPPA
jgi:hypothetical protein